MAANIPGLWHRYLVQAMMYLNKNRGLHLAILDINKGDLMGYNMVDLTMWDKTLKYKFTVRIYEDCFNIESTTVAVWRIERRAHMASKAMKDRQRIILRLAYCMWKDWKDSREEDID